MVRLSCSLSSLRHRLVYCARAPETSSASSTIPLFRTDSIVARLVFMRALFGSFIPREIHEGNGCGFESNERLANLKTISAPYRTDDFLRSSKADFMHVCAVGARSLPSCQQHPSPLAVSNLPRFPFQLAKFNLSKTSFLDLVKK